LEIPFLFESFAGLLASTAYQRGNPPLVPDWHAACPLAESCASEIYLVMRFKLERASAPCGYPVKLPHLMVPEQGWA
jgi:hypothetical protein